MSDISKMKKADLLALVASLQGESAPTDPRVTALIEAGVPEATALAAVANMDGAAPTAAVNAPPKVTRLDSVTFREAVTNVQTGAINPGNAECRAHVDKAGYVTFQPLLKDGAPRVTGEKSSRGPGHATGYSRVRTSFVRALLEMDADDREKLLDAADGDGLRSVASLD